MNTRLLPLFVLYDKSTRDNQNKIPAVIVDNGDFNII
jgi:hypothetical protein